MVSPNHKLQIRKPSRFPQVNGLTLHVTKIWISSWKVLTFDIYTWVCFHKTNKRGFASNRVLWKQMSAYSTGHGHCSIASMFHEWKSAILNANSTRKTRVKHLCEKVHAKLHEKIHINFPNLHVKLYKHIVIVCAYLVYLSSYIAGWAVLVRVALLAKIKLSRHVQMLVFYVIWAKSDPSFLTEWTLFLK